MLKGMMEFYEKNMFVNDLFNEALESCDNGSLKVPIHHDGKYEVEVLIHAPKALTNDRKRPCIVYAHGGGAIGGSAHGYQGFLAHMAMTCGVVVFNVDYRLAPETRCPNNILDFYEAIKYIIGHAGQLGVDSSRVCIAGESGGGYICSGAMVHLARKGEGHLVKLAIPVIPMLTDYSFTDKTAMTNAEAENAEGKKKVWRLIAGPKFEEMRGDPMLFPGKADRETLTKMPPTIIWEAEFDFYLTEGTRFANRLREAGRLLEFVVTPGIKHGSGMNPQNSSFKLEREAWRLAIQEYLIKKI